MFREHPKPFLLIPKMSKEHPNPFLFIPKMFRKRTETFRDLNNNKHKVGLRKCNGGGFVLFMAQGDINEENTHTFAKLKEAWWCERSETRPHQKKRRMQSLRIFSG
jgi:hypothetical protein